MKKYYQYYKYIPILQIFQFPKLEITRRKGQTLVSLLIFMVTAIIIITAAVALVMMNSKSTSKLYQGLVSSNTSEAGIENAIIRLLRDPSYTGETLTVDGRTIETQVMNQGNNYTIVSTGTNGYFKKTTTVTASYNNNVLNILTWKEQ